MPSQSKLFITAPSTKENIDKQITYIQSMNRSSKDSTVTYIFKNDDGTDLPIPVSKERLRSLSKLYSITTTEQQQSTTTSAETEDTKPKSKSKLKKKTPFQKDEVVSHFTARAFLRFLSKIYPIHIDKEDVDHTYVRDVFGIANKYQTRHILEFCYAWCNHQSNNISACEDYTEIQNDIETILHLIDSSNGDDEAYFSETLCQSIAKHFSSIPSDIKKSMDLNTILKITSYLSFVTTNSRKRSVDTIDDDYTTTTTTTQIKRQKL